MRPNLLTQDMPRLLLGLAIVVAACDGSSPAAPSPYPDVAGAYSGTVVLVVDELGQEPINGTMRIDVTQSGSQVTVSGSMSLFGETEEIGTVTGTINEAGEFMFPGDSFVSEAANDPDCGEHGVTMSLVFSDGTATFGQVVETAECGQFRLNATLTKE
ncbi:MAG: hypothetical protein F4X11_10685 [Acidobacteria bacterium]|nr:hypothetical protein [Acidobacteriota bacterium]